MCHQSMRAGDIHIEFGHDRLHRKMLALGFLARLVERGFVGALVGALLFVLVAPVISQASTSLLRISGACSRRLNGRSGGALGALIGAVILILVPAYALTSKA